MYSWIWQRLPGPLPTRLAGAVALAVAALTLLWFVLFPLVDGLLPFDDVTVG